MKRPSTVLLSLACLAALTGPPASAQEGQGGAGAEPEAEYESDDGEPLSPVQARIAEKRAARDEVFAEMRAEEVRHRERMGVIHRLAELAERSGDARRLALLDKLKVKEYARYHLQFERRRTQIDQDGFGIARLSLAKGRVRAAEAEELARSASKPRREKVRGEPVKRAAAGQDAPSPEDGGAGKDATTGQGKGKPGSKPRRR
jgi:hypothetical protein